MRIIKRDNGWWIIDVPSSLAGPERFTSCGPYETKAAAADDKLGLERFFSEQPVGESPLPGFPPPPLPSPHRATHWLARSLEFKPLRSSKPKARKCAPEQLTLPGF
jgi:hypothetical protein